MSIPENIYLDDFQKEVWNEYQSYNMLLQSYGLDWENTPVVTEKTFRGMLLSWFFRVFKWFFGGLIERVNKKQAALKNYRELEKEAAELKKEPEIKEAICQTISNLNRREILTEVKFVKLLTSAITDPRLVKKFVIPPNAVLYGIIAYQVFQVGLEKYCDEQKTKK